jgi:hypothetical protein
MVFRVVHRPPQTVADLTAAVGLSMTDLTAPGRFGMGSVVVPGRLSADYAWDMYHERPVASASDLAGRRLTRYAVWFDAGDRPACAAELFSAYGEPVAVAGRHRYGPFFLSEACALEWFASTPDWAKPPVDAAARVKAVERLVAGADLADLPPGLGITVSGTGVRLDPPMPAADVACAIGHPAAVAQTTDVHMSRWALVTVTGDRTSRPRVTAYLTGPATGGDVPGVTAPAARVARIGAADTIAVLDLE